jgi:type I restriction enzyme S subunit
MGKYNAYKKYKASGVEWLGEIPEHWKYVSLRWISQRYSGGTPDKTKSEYWVDGDIPWVNSGTVNQQTITEPSAYITREGFKCSSAKWVPINALLMALAGQGKTKGMVAQTKIRVTCNQSMAAIIFEKDNSRYFFWCLTSQYKQIRGLTSDEGRDGLNLEMIGSIPCPLPPLPEQQAIANFLDYKTKQIDALIAKKETLLEKFDEKRTAIISHAVTKGLDPNVPMKDSGIEWLGEIPEHWEKKRLKFVVSKIIDAEHKTALYDDNGDYLVVRTANVRTGELLLENAKFTNESVYKEWTVRAVPEQGDILFTREAPAGEACLVPEKPIVCLGQRMVLFKFDKNKYNGYFLLQSLYSGIADEFIKSLSLGSTVAHFNMSDITSIPLFIPPYNEQKQIAEYLDQQTAKIDQQKLKIQQAIDRLKEYRTALITNAVTGKIDVRQVSIS